MVLRRFSGNLYYVAFCLSLLPIMLWRDFTPMNELRYLSIADEALRNHTLFSFTNHGEPYADKPPLYFWFVMLGKWLFGTHQMWFLSLASLVPTVITVRTMDKWSASVMDGETALTARMVLLTCGLFAGLAVILRMDMLMCMFIVLALRAFYKMATMPDACKGEAWLFPVYVFLAVFSKGPVGLLVPLCSTFAFMLWKRRIRQFLQYWGWRIWGVLAAGCLIWFCAVYAEGGKDYLDNLLFHQTIDRAVNSFHHKEPFYYYAVSVWYSIAPWSLLVLGLLVAAFCKKLISTDLQRFYCTVIAVTFIMLSCISSKIEVYLLPAFPFMVYLAMSLLPRFRGEVWLNVLFAVTSALFAAALPVVLLVSLHDGTAYLRNALVYVAAAVLSLGGLLSLWRCFRAQKGLAAGLRVLAASLTFAIFVGGCALPSINPWIGYAPLCRKALEVASEKRAEGIATWNLSRAENMDVYLGRQVEVVRKEDMEKVHSRHRLVLMMRKRDLWKFKGTEACVVGPYAVVFLE